MIIGVPKEIKISENRVGLAESGVKQLVKEGHTLYVEKDAGLGRHTDLLPKPARLSSPNRGLDRMHYFTNCPRISPPPAPGAAQ